MQSNHIEPTLIDEGTQFPSIDFSRPIKDEETQFPSIDFSRPIQDEETQFPSIDLNPPPSQAAPGAIPASLPFTSYTAADKPPLPPGQRPDFSVSVTVSTKHTKATIVVSREASPSTSPQTSPKDSSDSRPLGDVTSVATNPSRDQQRGPPVTSQSKVTNATPTNSTSSASRPLLSLSSQGRPLAGTAGNIGVRRRNEGVPFADALGLFAGDKKTQLSTLQRKSSLPGSPRTGKVGVRGLARTFSDAGTGSSTGGRNKKTSRTPRPDVVKLISRFGEATNRKESVAVDSTPPSTAPAPSDPAPSDSPLRRWAHPKADEHRKPPIGGQKPQSPKPHSPIIQTPKPQSSEVQCDKTQSPKPKSLNPQSAALSSNEIKETPSVNRQNNNASSTEKESKRQNKTYTDEELEELEDWSIDQTEIERLIEKSAKLRRIKRQDSLKEEGITEAKPEDIKNDNTSSTDGIHFATAITILNSGNSENRALTLDASGDDDNDDDDGQEDADEAEGSDKVAEEIHVTQEETSSLPKVPNSPQFANQSERIALYKEERKKQLAYIQDRLGVDLTNATDSAHDSKQRLPSQESTGADSSGELNQNKTNNPTNAWYVSNFEWRERSHPVPDMNDQANQKQPRKIIRSLTEGTLKLDIDFRNRIRSSPFENSSSATVTHDSATARTSSSSLNSAPGAVAPGGADAAGHDDVFSEEEQHDAPHNEAQEQRAFSTLSKFGEVLGTPNSTCGQFVDVLNDRLQAPEKEDSWLRQPDKVVSTLFCPPGSGVSLNSAEQGDKNEVKPIPLKKLPSDAPAPAQSFTSKHIRNRRRHTDLQIVHGAGRLHKRVNSHDDLEAILTNGDVASSTTASELSRRSSNTSSETKSQFLLRMSTPKHQQCNTTQPCSRTANASPRRGSITKVSPRVSPRKGDTTPRDVRISPRKITPRDSLKTSPRRQVQTNLVDVLLQDSPKTKLSPKKGNTTLREPQKVSPQKQYHTTVADILSTEAERLVKPSKYRENNALQHSNNDRANNTQQRNKINESRRPSWGFGGKIILKDKTSNHVKNISDESIEHLKDLEKTESIEQNSNFQRSSVTRASLPSSLSCLKKMQRSHSFKESIRDTTDPPSAHVSGKRRLSITARLQDLKQQESKAHEKFEKLFAKNKDSFNKEISSIEKDDAPSANDKRLKEIKERADQELGGGRKEKDSRVLVHPSSSTTSGASYKPDKYSKHKPGRVSVTSSRPSTNLTDLVPYYDADVKATHTLVEMNARKIEFQPMICLPKPVEHEPCLPEKEERVDDVIVKIHPALPVPVLVIPDDINNDIDDTIPTKPYEVSHAAPSAKSDDALQINISHSDEPNIMCNAYSMCSVSPKQDLKQTREPDDESISSSQTNTTNNGKVTDSILEFEKSIVEDKPLVAINKDELESNLHKQQSTGDVVLLKSNTKLSSVFWKKDQETPTPWCPAKDKTSRSGDHEASRAVQSSAPEENHQSESKKLKVHYGQCVKDKVMAFVGDSNDDCKFYKTNKTPHAKVAQTPPPPVTNTGLHKLKNVNSAFKLVNPGASHAVNATDADKAVSQTISKYVASRTLFDAAESNKVPTTAEKDNIKNVADFNKVSNPKGERDSERRREVIRAVYTVSNKLEINNASATNGLHKIPNACEKDKVPHEDLDNVSKDNEIDAISKAVGHNGGSNEEEHGIQDTVVRSNHCSHESRSEKQNISTLKCVSGSVHDPDKAETLEPVKTENINRKSSAIEFLTSKIRIAQHQNDTINSDNELTKYDVPSITSDFYNVQICNVDSEVQTVPEKLTSLTSQNTSTTGLCDDEKVKVAKPSHVTSAPEDESAPTIKKSPRHKPGKLGDRIRFLESLITNPDTQNPFLDEDDVESASVRQQVQVDSEQEHNTSVVNKPQCQQPDLLNQIPHHQPKDISGSASLNIASVSDQPSCHVPLVTVSETRRSEPKANRSTPNEKLSPRKEDTLAPLRTVDALTPARVESLVSRLDVSFDSFNSLFIENALYLQDASDLPPAVESSVRRRRLSCNRPKGGKEGRRQNLGSESRQVGDGARLHVGSISASEE